MKFWAHRGCSQRYPENTLISFSKAAELFEKGLTGIELDIQLTKDGKMVVIHDERIDRTTDGFGFVRDYSLEELRTFHIHTGEERAERIPTLEEVLDLLEEKLKKGLQLNIELKNSIYPYPGMEKMVVEMIHKRGLEESIVYSSFYARSLMLLHEIDPEARCGMLASRVSDSLYLARGLGFIKALHPYWQGMDLTASELPDMPVRAYFSGHLYPEKPTGGRLDLAALEAKGITDVFINEPEVYLG